MQLMENEPPCQPSSEYVQCEAYLKQGAALVVAVFMSWFGARKEGEWLKEKDNQCDRADRWERGNTPLHLALLYKAPAAVAMALHAAWPDAVKEKNNKGDIPLFLALENNAPEAVVMALLAAWPYVVVS